MNNVRSLLGKAKEDIISLIIVSVAFFVALSIRIRPADSVFLPNGFVRFSNDPLYHMRWSKCSCTIIRRGCFITR